MSSDWKNLEAEFKKFRLEENPTALKEEPSSVTKSCSCPNISIINKPFSLLEVTGNRQLKVKDKKGSGLIKPARLKVIGNCFAKKLKTLNDEDSNAKMLARRDIENFTSEAFLKMRISSSASPSCEISRSPADVERAPSTASSSSSSLNCSTQAKLQQQFSSTEFDSTIDEMSDFLAYHLSLFNHRDNLIDSMYT